MKKQNTQNKNVETCWQNFIVGHPELTVNSGNQLTMLLASEKAVYAKVGIMYAVDFMNDEIARMKK